MITLKGSRFIVEHDENAKTDTDYKVFISRDNEYKDITNAMDDSDKEELISDLIYAVHCLLQKG